MRFAVLESKVMSKLTVELFLGVDYEDFVAEIWDGDREIAEVTIDGENLVIHIMPHTLVPSLSMEDFAVILVEARSRLLAVKSEFAPDATLPAKVDDKPDTELDGHSAVA